MIDKAKRWCTRPGLWAGLAGMLLHTHLAARALAQSEELPASLIASREISSGLPITGQILQWSILTFFAIVLAVCLVILWSVKLRRKVNERTAELQREVEQRTRALEMHVQSEERFRALIDQASDGIYIADPTGTILDINTQGCTILDTSAEELVGSNLSDLVPKYELPRLRDELGQLQQGETVVSERNMQRADGTLVPIESSTKQLPDGRVLGIFRDISKRKLAEEVLREREVQYRRLIESANAIPYEFHIGKKRFSFVGPQAVAILGYPLHRWFEENFWAGHVHPEDREDAGNYTRQAIAAGIDHSFEYRMRHQDGHYVWLRDNVRVVMGDEGPAMIRGFLFDITERRLAEEAQRESEERYRVVAKTATDAIITVDSDYHIAFANPASEAIFGYERHELIGKPLAALIPGFSGPRMLPARDGSSTSNAVEVEGKRYDGSRVPLEVSFGEIVKGGRVQYTGIFRDVSQRKRAEEERKALEAQMQHTQKLESLGVLAGGIAHDFNNLLVGILGHAELAAMDLPDDSPARAAVEEISLAARRAADLTNQMLAFSGKGRFVVQTLGVNSLVEEMSHLLRTFISKRAQLEFNLSDRQPAVVGDASQIRQVLMNLITNASDALGDKNGQIAVRTGVMTMSPEWLKDAYIEVEDPSGEYAFVEVTDTGCGMDDETQRRIFDPFFTTKFTGRGLGLAAVLGIVRGHHGAIKVRSVPGVGTSITVLLPLAQEVPMAEPEAPRVDTSKLSERRYTGTVLLVDDDDTVRLVGKAILQRFGFTVLTACDGAEGVEMFRDHAKEIDAVILDMTMPNLNGEEAFNAMNDIRPGVRALLSSGYSEQEATSKFSGYGLAGFIQKPYMANDLVEKVAQVVAERKPVQRLAVI
jgi:two-component system, cell cycle sensor histidine kinase and response regulator CckA